jgi:beta-glucanase (GH16 family)
MPVVAIVLGASLWFLGTAGHRASPAALATTAVAPSQPARHAARPGAPDAGSGQDSPGAGHSLEFDASFPGSRLNTSLWSTCYPWMDRRSGCTNFGNPEYQWYLPSQDRVSGGVLRLVAKRSPTAGRTRHGAAAEYGCRSGMITTYPSLRFKYGYIQVVARIPASPGLWPALWLAAANFRWPPEIDMMEKWGTTDDFSVFFHPAGTDHVPAMRSRLSPGWHAFSLSWTKSHLAWYVDGRKILTVRQRIPHQRMYFIADLAEAEYPKTTAECSGTMLIRSVKVWKN